MVGWLVRCLRGLRRHAPESIPGIAPEDPFEYEGGPSTDERPVELLAPPVVPRPITVEHKRVIQSIIGVFETGVSGGGDYGTVAVLKDGAGISYGKHQATDHSDTLDQIVFRYLDLGGGLHGEALRPYVAMLSDDVTAQLDPDDLPGWCLELMEILRRAGADPVMQLAQDQVFEEAYWAPAEAQALAMQLVEPLSWAVVYDSTIHSGPNGVARIRKLFPEVPPSSGGEEHAWTEAYLVARRKWLASHPTSAVRATVYRMDALHWLLREGNWKLRTPIPIRLTLTRDPVIVT